MRANGRRNGQTSGAGLAQLVRDTTGNTLAMVAAAMIPVAALAGSAIDTARIYVVKVRLQQACDAGVLAGRKFMASSNSASLDGNATTQARAFFANNFRTGWMQTGTVGFTPTKTADQQVAGTATAKVPMTIMKMFAAPDVTLNVICEARYDVADTDVMFVLDTTGSMACPANDTTSACTSGNARTYARADGSTGYFVLESPNAKIRALRAAVLNFYDTMRNNADPTTNIRYGFVPYSSNVNVGRLIPPAMLWTGSYGYSSREIDGEANRNNAFDETVGGRTSGNCGAVVGRYPNAAADTRQGWYTDSTAYYYTSASWTNSRCVARRQNVRPVWRYGVVDLNTADYAAGRDVVDPTKLSGELTDRWRGCIEERRTDAVTSFDLNNLPPDLDPDLAPSGMATMWKPSWPDVVYDRTGPADIRSTADRINVGADDRLLLGYAPCGAQARRLDTMTRTEVETYLSPNGDFRPIGGTYHDVGMIWGTRMIAPDGIFSADTAAWPGRNAPNRHIIFMTDGAMSTNLDSYGLYGIEKSDRRVTGTSPNTQLDRHNTRFVTECQAARARNITVWVIAFGEQLNNELRACATQDNNHVFFAADDVALEAAFRNIATQVAMLRVSR